MIASLNMNIVTFIQKVNIFKKRGKKIKLILDI